MAQPVKFINIHNISNLNTHTRSNYMACSAAACTYDVKMHFHAKNVWSMVDVCVLYCLCVADRVEQTHLLHQLCVTLYTPFNESKAYVCTQADSLSSPTHLRSTCVINNHTFSVFVWVCLRFVILSQCYYLTRHRHSFSSMLSGRVWSMLTPTSN